MKAICKRKITKRKCAPRGDDSVVTTDMSSNDHLTKGTLKQ